MFDGLQSRLGAELADVDLRLNWYDGRHSRKPVIVWCHGYHYAPAYVWINNPEPVAHVSRFVFVSEWQREQFLANFPTLPAERCVVLRNAIATGTTLRTGPPSAVVRCAYTSAPNRGLATLLDVWERLAPTNAELHVWSGLRLYGAGWDDAPWQATFDRCAALPGVFYRGVVPNDELRRELQYVDILAYPSDYEETSCISVIEALEAGCRVVCTSLAALPETASGWARLTPVGDVGAFAEALAEEIAHQTITRLTMLYAQQHWARVSYGWDRRISEWRQMIAGIA